MQKWGRDGYREKSDMNIIVVGRGRGMEGTKKRGREMCQMERRRRRKRSIFLGFSMFF